MLRALPMFMSGVLLNRSTTKSDPSAVINVLQHGGYKWSELFLLSAGRGQSE